MGAVVSCGAVVGVAVAQAESTMAAMNKIDTIACSELFLDTKTPPKLCSYFYNRVEETKIRCLFRLLFYASLLSSQQLHSKDIVIWLS